MLPQPQQSLVIAIHMGLRGGEAALVNGAGEVEWMGGVRLPAPTAQNGFGAQDFAAIQEAFRRLCQGVGAARGDRAVRGIALATPADTVMLLGSENRRLTPMLFGRGVGVPGRDVPADLLGDAGAVAFFRRSPIRQLAVKIPELPLEVRRVVSLDAALCHEMSRQWVATAACPPVGFPYDVQRSQPIDSEGFWAASGVLPSVAPLLVPPGGVQAQVSAEFAKTTGIAPHCPLISVGSDLGALAAGVEAHARRWLVELGGGLRLAWTGPSPAPDARPWWAPDPGAVTLQIREDGGLEEASDPHMPQEALRMGDWVTWQPGPGVQGATFAGHAALDFAQHPWMQEALTQAGEVPIGSEGLRFLPGPTTANFLGLKSHHGPAHMGRAVIEGLAMELRRWASEAFAEQAVQPIRLVIPDAWPQITAQIFADVLEGPVFVLTQEQAQRQRLIGAGLSVLSGLGFPTPERWHTDPPQVVEPTQTTYRPLYLLHTRLMETANPLLS